MSYAESSKLHGRKENKIQRKQGNKHNNGIETKKPKIIIIKKKKKKKKK